MSPQSRVDIGSTFLLKILLSFSWCLIQSRWSINLGRTRKIKLQRVPGRCPGIGLRILGLLIYPSLYVF